MAYSQLELPPSTKAACLEIIRKIESGEITSQNLEPEKCRIAGKYGIGAIPKNAEIFSLAEKESLNYELIKRTLRIKPVRTISGVANIAIMWLDKEHRSPYDPEKYYSCPAACIYCAQGSKNPDGTIIQAPKSYTGCEPTTMRAIRNDFDPWKQVVNRIRQLHIIGHSTDKCELIIMGGTFTSMPFEYQQNFVKRSLDAFNGFDSASPESAQEANETATNRCIGLTIETRADFCFPKHVSEMLSLGCTRVELGVQSTSDTLLKAIKRGHGAAENINAIRNLKDAGLKFTAHWMPGLTGLTGEIDEAEEIRLFEELFENPGYRPDELKIYPMLVLPGTELHGLWQRGEYKPLSREQMLKLLTEMKKIVPRYVRIKRVMRDISEHEAVAGASTTNLRQLARIEMEKAGIACRCIRCREIGFAGGKPDEFGFFVDEYESSAGMEFFISCEDARRNILAGFLRLRLANEKQTGACNASSGSAFVRELHVYGEMTPVGQASKQAQHLGLGKALMKKAEEIAAERGMKKIRVTSGIGVRDYYRKLGYIFEKPYMAKLL